MKYSKEYFLNRYHERKKNMNNKCKHCGNDISNLNIGKAPSQRRITCKECGNREERGEYIFRILVKRQKIGKNKKNVYGVTIPSSIVEKYNLLGKKFKINTGLKGKFILYTQVKH